MVAAHALHPSHRVRVLECILHSGIFIKWLQASTNLGFTLVYCWGLDEGVCELVQELQPQSVAVELCRSRAGVMYDDPASPEVSTSGRVEPIALPQ